MLSMLCRNTNENYSLHIKKHNGHVCWSMMRQTLSLYFVNMQFNSAYLTDSPSLVAPCCPSDVLDPVPFVNMT